jgi:hypothetical protein
MKASALAISMILILVPLAGCSGTDTEVNVDLSNEDINDLIDENLEDVMNNTTVVVFQEYHNETTVINQYSNNTTTNVDESGTSTSTTTYNYNGSAGESELFVIRLEFDFSDVIGEITLKRDNNFTVWWSYYDYATNDDRNDQFTLACSNYYDAPVQSSNSTSTNPPYWDSNGDVQDDYVDWWIYQFNNTIRDLLQEMAYNGDVEDVCRETNDDNVLIDDYDYRVYVDQWNDRCCDYSSAPIFYGLSIPNGSAIEVIQITSTHSWDYVDDQGRVYPQSSEDFWTINGVLPRGDCSDLQVIIYYHPQSCGGIYGGWEDIDLDFQITSSVYDNSEFEFTIYYRIIPVTSL